MYSKKYGGLQEVETDGKDKMKDSDIPLWISSSSVVGWDLKHGSYRSSARFEHREFGDGHRKATSVLPELVQTQR
jgi:hypothetical protein